MRFSDTTQQAILKLFLEGMTIARIASCYTTGSEAIEKIIRVQSKLMLDKEVKEILK